LDRLYKAIAEFAVTDVDFDIEPASRTAIRRSLDESGLLLLGEMHGVRENPLLIRALMQEFDLNSLALEWFDGLGSALVDFLAQGVLTDHDQIWWGDGRITAGHLAMLSKRAVAGSLNLILFNGIAGADLSWSDRDEAMARRILAASSPGSRTLAVAGNAHTPTSPTELGVPLGAHLARQRPGVRDILISYRGGRFYNFEPHQFHFEGTVHRRIRIYEHEGQLILDLPWPMKRWFPIG
jgi:hypothetical protein